MSDSKPDSSDRPDDTVRHDLADLRREYSFQPLRREHLDVDPMRQFDVWFKQALEVDATEPTIIDLRSGLCGDAGVREVIDGAADELAGIGVSAVRCYERHGALAFEQPL